LRLELFISAYAAMQAHRTGPGGVAVTADAPPVWRVQAQRMRPR